MRDFPPGTDDNDGWPYTWDECQDFIERPRMRRESDVAYATRLCVARLSREIRASLLAAQQRLPRP